MNRNNEIMNWDSLICDVRLGMEEFHSGERQSRSDFQRDYDRMIFSSPFRRLQNKTQVFPLPGHIFVHNRLTHSLEVSSVGRSLANEVAIKLRAQHQGEDWVWKLDHIGDIVAAACLCHDIGNPPFGHGGEKTIATWFSEGNGSHLEAQLAPTQWTDFTHFEGNANSFRVLTHKFVGRREGGFAMTYSTLASIVKYPYSSDLAKENGKFGFFDSEKELWERVAQKLGIIRHTDGRYARHPLVYIMEAADDICYQIMDIEDAHKLKILTTNKVKDLLLGYFPENEQEKARRSMQRLADPNEQIAYLRSKTIGVLVGDCARVFAENEQTILQGKMEGELIENLDKRLREGYERCSETAWDKIYRAPEVIDIEIAGNRIISYLMDTLTEAALHPERNFSKLLMERIPAQYDIKNPDLYTKLQAVLDHVSGMTDVYALDLFRKLNGHSLPAV